MCLIEFGPRSEDIVENSIYSCFVLQKNNKLLIVHFELLVPREVFGILLARAAS